MVLYSFLTFVQKLLEPIKLKALSWWPAVLEFLESSWKFFKCQKGSLNSIFFFEFLGFSLNFYNFPWVLLLNVLLNILCWIVVPKFVWSTFVSFCLSEIYLFCLTSVIYAHKKWFFFSDMIQLKLPFCCWDRIDIANMSKKCLFQAACLTE